MARPRAPGQQLDLDLDGGIAPRVEHLAPDDLDDRAHRRRSLRLGRRPRTVGSVAGVTVSLTRPSRPGLPTFNPLAPGFAADPYRQYRELVRPQPGPAEHLRPVDALPLRRLRPVPPRSVAERGGHERRGREPPGRAPRAGLRRAGAAGHPQHPQHRPSRPHPHPGDRPEGLHPASHRAAHAPRAGAGRPMRSTAWWRGATGSRSSPTSPSRFPSR